MSTDEEDIVLNVGPSEPKKRRVDVVCEQCQEQKSKYTCPKCAIRTCSVECVKKHKESRLCDGAPRKWTAVAPFTEFDPKTSIRDQQFLHDIGEKIGTKAADQTEQQQIVEKTSPVEEKPHHRHSNTVRFLLQNCRNRKIWLSVDDGADVGQSRHENFSDTIFWTIKVTFARTSNWVPTASSFPLENAKPSQAENMPTPSGEVSTPAKPINTSHVHLDNEEVEDGELGDDDVDDGEIVEDEEPFKPKESNSSATNSSNGEVNDSNVEEISSTISSDNDEIIEDSTPLKHSELSFYSHVVHNIPESLTLRTLIRQFTKPKGYGCVVSKSDLDLEKMKPFMEFPDKLWAFMPVTCADGTVKYYVLDTEKKISENLYKKFVTGFPEVIIVINADPVVLEQPTEEELNALTDSRHPHDGNRPENRRPHYGNGFRGFRGGFRRHGSNRNFSSDQRFPPRNNQNRAQKRQFYRRDDPLDRILSAKSLTMNDIRPLD